MRGMGPGLFLLLVWPLCLAHGEAYLGDYSGHVTTGRSVTIHAGDAAVRLVAFRADIVRVDFLPSSATVIEPSLAVIADTLEAPPFSAAETQTHLRFSAGDLAVVCTKRPLRFAFEAGGMTVLEEPPEGGMSAEGVDRAAVFSLSPDVHLYGTGERGTSLDTRGQRLHCYNVHQGGYTGPLAAMGVNVPFIASSGGFGLFFDTTYPGWLDLGSSNPARLAYETDGGELSFFVMAGETIPALVEAFTWLTGRQPLPPLWAFGYIQSKYGYRNEIDLREAARLMRERRIPCDAFVLDLYWFRHMGDLAWDTAAWPNPFTLMRDLEDQGFKTIAITEPYIVEYSPNFPEAALNGFLARTESGVPYRLHHWWSCGCDAGLLDLTDPEAGAWWWAKHPQFFRDELDGIWTDLGEPETHPDGMQHAMGDARKVHNVFNLLWAKTVFDGFLVMRPGQRLFNLTRAGSAGIQRYGVIPWSGDVGTEFGGLAVQLPMMLSMGMSGLAYHNSDIGGFCCGVTTPELYTRWMQYGTFCPVTRAHGVDYQPQEPWGYGAEAEAICRTFIELRYRLIPYLYTLAHENWVSGMPLARPLFFLDRTDSRLTDESSTYLWGDAFLVSPVVERGQTTKTVCLPSGAWYDFWTDALHEGPDYVSVAAPLNVMPLFVKAGSIIPMWPLVQSTAYRPPDTLALAVYPGSSGGGFSLYEDDGTTLEYQQGAYATTEIRTELRPCGGASTLVVDIDRPQGRYQGQAQERIYLATIHGVTAPPRLVRKDGGLLPRAPSCDDLRAGGEGWAFDRAGLLHVRCDVAITRSCRVEAESLTVLIKSGTPPPREFSLAAFPNPFSHRTRIRFGMPVAGVVRLALYDASGRELAELLHEERAAGMHEVRVDLDGPGLASAAVAFCRLVVEGATEDHEAPLLWSQVLPMVHVREE